MLIGNRTDTVRAIPTPTGFLTVPAMGFIEVTDAGDIEAVNSFKGTEAGKRLLEHNILVFGKVTSATTPVEVEGKQPPEELLAEPPSPRVKRGKAKKVGEMKV